LAYAGWRAPQPPNPSPIRRIDPGPLSGEPGSSFLRSFSFSGAKCPNFAHVDVRRRAGLRCGCAGITHANGTVQITFA
jgi:hypothetical protein